VRITKDSFPIIEKGLSLLDLQQVFDFILSNIAAFISRGNNPRTMHLLTLLKEKGTIIEMIRLLITENPAYVEQIKHITKELSGDTTKLYYYLMFFFLYENESYPMKMIFKTKAIDDWGILDIEMLNSFFSIIYNMKFIDVVLQMTIPVFHTMIDFKYEPYSGDGPDSYMMVLMGELLKKGTEEIMDSLIAFFNDLKYWYYSKFLIEYYVEELILALDDPCHNEYVHFREIYMFLNFIYKMAKRGILFRQMKQFLFSNLVEPYDNVLGFILNEKFRTYIYNVFDNALCIIKYQYEISKDSQKIALHDAMIELDIDISSGKICGVELDDFEGDSDEEAEDEDFDAEADAHGDDYFELPPPGSIGSYEDNAFIGEMMGKRTFPRFLRILTDLYSIYC